ncbi:DMT family transporter [Deinococcus cellulosilyticus]|uniref:QacE family quaternary ammonium compound efflux SMR transporter n=1 Tax=Deinococcus cellulosilyticus (strain DSM 18568 / NBRC 106333 / KACC 11606 / 5516J-15) TaxID=1223518 RepID=A0A511N670_DEIC1|nr:multidrug efflux SMR transporter [Deinococcus cellulosilyticus]GEM48360.1 QacE family quaternary ammonium compound efflux SMR transporter [Deinococcus cellulosilyticus NBRC 106333 = KACC 11606]
MNGWMWLLLAGIFEIGFTTAMKLQQQNESYGIVFLVCVILSFECLSKAIKTIPLSTGYAIWTGIGAVGTLIVGAVLFQETLSPLRMLLLILLIAVLVGLKFATPQKKAA